jgi:transketolase
MWPPARSARGFARRSAPRLNAKRIASSYRTYALLGDGESAEGSVWEAADAAGFFGLDSLCAIIDVNALGQSQPTQWQHDMEGIAARWRAFKWNTLVIDGHDLQAILDALATAAGNARPPDDDSGAHAQGQGGLALRGQAGLARQGAQEGQ